MAWPIAAGSVVGSSLGALSSKRLSMRAMLIVFLIVLPYFAAKELFPSLQAPALGAGLIPLGILGFATGYMSGLLGLSGAGLVVPSLVAFFLIDHHVAQGVAMSVAMADSLAGAITHSRMGNTNYRIVLYMAGPAVAAALVGAFVSNMLSGEVLRFIFGGFLIVMSVVLLIRVVRSFWQGRAASPAEWSVHTKVGEGAAAQNGTPLADNSRRVGKRAAGGRIAWFGRGAALTHRHIWNALLIFVALAIVGHWLHFGSVFVFVCSAVACVPLSFRLGQATESLGSHMGPVAGGLLNATFGNAAELIITILALNHGLYALVRTTLIGSIIGQLLLVLGTSLLLAGFKYKHLRFNRALVQTNFALMVIALVAIGLPAIRQLGIVVGPEAGASFLSPALAVMLIIVYGASVVFSLRNQTPDQGEPDREGPQWSTRKGFLILVAATGGIVFISELLVDSVVPFVEATGVSQVFIGLILIPIFSNVVDHMVAITMAMKNKMDLSLVVSVGSAAQVACLVLPIIVIIAYATGQSAGMVFSPVELLVLGAGLFLMVPVLLDGDSNWFEGAELLMCYFIISAVLLTF